MRFCESQCCSPRLPRFAISKIRRSSGSRPHAGGKDLSRTGRKLGDRARKVCTMTYKRGRDIRNNVAASNGASQWRRRMRASQRATRRATVARESKARMHSMQLRCEPSIVRSLLFSFFPRFSPAEFSRASAHPSVRVHNHSSLKCGMRRCTTPTRTRDERTNAHPIRSIAPYDCVVDGESALQIARPVNLCRISALAKRRGTIRGGRFSLGSFPPCFITIIRITIINSKCGGIITNK